MRRNHDGLSDIPLALAVSALALGSIIPLAAILDAVNDNPRPVNECNQPTSTIQLGEITCGGSEVTLTTIAQD